MDSKIRKLSGANMDVDFSNKDWAICECPWNVADKTDEHKCAVKNISICKYFCGVEYMDSVLCSYPYENTSVLDKK